jgi:hypothetical protein
VTAPWDRRSAAEHRRVAAMALEAWLPTAISFSAYWSERAAEVGGGERPTTEADLLRFPPVREADVRGAGGPGCPALLMRPTQEQVRARASSSTLFRIARAIRQDGGDVERRTLLEEYKPIHVHRGGADDDLAIAYSRSDLDRLHRCGARAAHVLGLDDADYLVNAVPAGPRLGWWGVYHLALGSSILALHPRGASDPLERVLESFALVPATVVAVPLEEAVTLANLMAEHGVEAPRVHTVLTVGPPPDEATRAHVRDAWRAAGATESDLVVRAVFAPPEARALWAEPRAEPTGLVTYPDLERLEVVDALTGEPVDGPGDLTVTTVGWHGTALVRYQTGVRVGGIDTEACPASGITAPRIVGDVVEHAWQPLVVAPDGFERHFDFRVAGAILASVPGIADWRVELHGPAAGGHHDRVVVEVAGDLDERDHQDLAQRMDVAAGAPPEEVRVVADPATIERQVDRLGTPFVDMR